MSAKELSLESFPVLWDVILAVLHSTGEFMTPYEIAVKAQGIAVKPCSDCSLCLDQDPWFEKLLILHPKAIHQKLVEMIQILSCSNQRSWLQFKITESSGEIEVKIDPAQPDQANEKLKEWADLVDQLALRLTDHLPD